MTYKKYKIKNKITNTYQNYIEFELDGNVEFNDKKQKFIFCVNKYPFIDYQIGEKIEINLTNAKRMNSQNLHQDLIRKVSTSYTPGYYDDYSMPQEENEGKLGDQQSQEQKQMSAYQKEVAYRKFQSAIKWLEKYIEIAYGEQFPDWESRKQFLENGIPRTDIIGNPERTEKLFSFALYGLEGHTDHPDLQAKMKEEFYQWISATRIDVNNCPNKLKYYLFGFSEILEGRGEKIVAEGDNRKDTFNVDSPEYARGLNAFFASLHSGPMQEAREREGALKGKSYSDLKVGSNFSGNEEEGKNTFQRIKDYVLSSSNYENFHFFPQRDQQSASSGGGGTPRNQEIRWDLIIEIDQNKNDWEIRKETITYDPYGREKKDDVLILKTIKLDSRDYNQATGELVNQPSKVYRKDYFSEKEWVEIIAIFGVSIQFNQQLVNEIKQSARLERGLFVINRETGERSENEDWFIHNSLERKIDNRTGYLIHVPNAMFRAKDLSEAEQKAVGYKSEQSLQNSSTSTIKKNDDKGIGTGGIFSIIGVISVLLIVSVVVAKKRLNKKSR